MASDATKFKFTKSSVEAIPFTLSRNARKEFRDTELPGLVLRVGMESKSYYLIKYDNEARRQIKVRLGSYPDLLPQDARDKATGTLREAGRKGGMAKQKIAAEHSTLSKLWTVYEEAHANVHLKETTRSNYIHFWSAHIEPRFGRRDPQTVTRADVRAAFNKLAEDSWSNANKFLTVLSSIYSFAMSEGILDDNPAHMIKRKPSIRRSRRLDKHSMKDAFELIESFPPLYKNALFLFLLLGQRRTETATMEWGEIDMKDWVWTIPGDDILGYKKGKTKNGLTHTVPLPPMAQDVIREMHKSTGSGRFVLRSDGFAWNKDMTQESPIGPATLTQYVADKFKEGEGKIAAPKFTPHDLRRTAYTQIASITDSLETTKRVFNHIVDSGASSHYDYHHYNPVKLKALSAWEERLRGWIGK